MERGAGHLVRGQRPSVESGRWPGQKGWGAAEGPRAGLRPGVAPPWGGPQAAQGTGKADAEGDWPTPRSNPWGEGE